MCSSVAIYFVAEYIMQIKMVDKAQKNTLAAQSYAAALWRKITENNIFNSVINRMRNIVLNPKLI